MKERQRVGMLWGGAGKRNYYYYYPNGPVWRTVRLKSGPNPVRTG